MYAIIEAAGKQYKVTSGDIITTEKLDAPEGGELVFDKVLAVLGGKAPQFGSPYVKGASVSATALEHARAKKVVVYKFKAKKGFHKKRGHRQPYTRLKIDAINV